MSHEVAASINSPRQLPELWVGYSMAEESSGNWRGLQSVTDTEADITEAYLPLAIVILREVAGSITPYLFLVDSAISRGMTADRSHPYLLPHQAA